MRDDGVIIQKIIDGDEEAFGQGGGAIPGFFSYILKNPPDANTFKIRDNNGREATVVLEDISKTEYANIKGIKFDDISLTVVPLSGTGNIFAGELTDKFTLNISKYAQTTGIHSSFWMENADGEIGHAFGGVMLKGYNDEYKYNTITSNSGSSYNMNAEKLMLYDLWVTHNFARNFSFGQSEYECSVIVPNEGNSVDCNITLFDAEGIKFIIKSVRNKNGVLIVETETIDNVKNKHRTKAQFNIITGVYTDWNYDDYDDLDEQGNPTVKTVENTFVRLQSNNDRDEEYDNYYDVFRSNLITCFSDEVKPGDEIYIQIDNMMYNYQWDKTSERMNYDNWRDPAKNLGTIYLK